MKVSIAEILESTTPLSLLTGTDMPINVAYKLASLVGEVNVILKEYDKKKSKLFDQYGERTEGSSVSILDEHVSVYQEEHKILLEETVDINIRKITIEMFGDINIKPATLVALKWLIDP